MSEPTTEPPVDEPADQAPYDPAGDTVDGVVDHVGGDLDEAQRVLDAERAGKNRSTLVRRLEDLLDPATGAEVDGRGYQVFDGGTHEATIPTGVQVTAVVDLTTGTALDPAEYTVSDGLLEREGATGGHGDVAAEFAPGTGRWAVEYTTS